MKLKLKLLNFFNKRNRKNSSGKKRKIFASAVVGGNLLFGNLKPNDFKTQNYSNATPLTQEKVILKSNSFDPSYNSGKTIQTGSGYVIKIQNQQTQPSEALKSALEIRSGDLGKGSSQGSRAKADARRNAQAGKFSSGSTIIPGADGYLPQNMYCRYHQNAPLSCKPKVKVSNSPFQDNGGDNQPPPENGNFDASQYKGGPNPFLDKFDYDNPNHTRENTDFSSQKRMNHAYDRHADKCFGMKENRNKENLIEFEGKARSFIESPETEKINGSYRYETPAYFYKEKDGNLVAIVNATDNSFITVVNATESQLESIKENQNFGLDTRPSMSLILSLRGPKNNN
uniref:hypothetical protein n=1 Tax=Psammodictyon constrictum TaxID=515483 RepID=UPI001EF9EA87|nr:hypothetical protein MKU01_pgp113 [Psammodictyon constrictum]ULD16380.1 hypothetical protein [Psammodictyon constrictum]